MLVGTEEQTTTLSFLGSHTFLRQHFCGATVINVKRNHIRQSKTTSYRTIRTNTFYLSLPVREMETLGRDSASKLAPFSFVKYQGLGNDFVIIDNFFQSVANLTVEQAKFICDRRFGIGADGVILLLPPKDSKNDSQMRIINSDGSEPEMCGNGIRCLAKYMKEVHSEWERKRILRIETLAGIMMVEYVAERGIKVDMGKPILDPFKVPTTLKPQTEKDTAVIDVPIQVEDRTFRVTCVSMGNPHCIIFVDDLEEMEKTLDFWGPRIEQSKWFPKRTNVEFVKVIDQKQIKVVVWERGAGRTLACGTGACAAVVAVRLMVSE